MNSKQQIEKSFDEMTRKEQRDHIKQNIIKKVETINKLSGKNYHFGKTNNGYYCLSEEPLGSSSRYRFMNKNLEDMQDIIFDILYTLRGY